MSPFFDEEPKDMWVIAGLKSQKAEAARHRLGEGGHFIQEHAMHYVYLIESVNDHERHYVGQTNNLKVRLAEHNTGKSIHTRRYKP